MAKISRSPTGSGLLRQSNHRGSLPIGVPNTSTFWKRIRCMQFLIEDMECSLTLSQIVLMRSHVVAVVHERCSFTRGSKCSELTGKMFMLCIGGRLREVVAHGCSTVIEKSTILAMIGQNIIFPHRFFMDFQFNFLVLSIAFECHG